VDAVHFAGVDVALMVRVVAWRKVGQTDAGAYVFYLNSVNFSTNLTKNTHLFAYVEKLSYLCERKGFLII
jgi:hypothetical protein